MGLMTINHIHPYTVFDGTYVWFMPPTSYVKIPVICPILKLLMNHTANILWRHLVFVYGDLATNIPQLPFVGMFSFMLHISYPIILQWELLMSHN